MMDARIINRTTEYALGQRVRKAREVRGISQEKLGRMLGITFQQVQKYEKGINRICATRLLQIARLLEMPISDFLEEDHKTTPLVREALTPAERKLLYNFRDLKPAQQRSIDNIVIALATVNCPVKPSLVTEPTRCARTMEMAI